MTIKTKHTKRSTLLDVGFSRDNIRLAFAESLEMTVPTEEQHDNSAARLLRPIQKPRRGRCVLSVDIV